MSRRTVVAIPGTDGAVGQLVRVNGMLFSSSITAADPQSGKFSRDPGQKLATAFGNLQRLLELDGAGPENLGLVTVCISDPAHRALVDEPWRGMFPGSNAPARSLNEYPLPDGELVQLQVIGVPGQVRTRLDLPGLAQHDSAPVGVRIGKLVFSSPISGMDPSTGQLIDEPEGQVRQAFRNVETLVQQAGGTKDDVAHVLIFVRDRADNDYTLHSFLEWFPVDGDRPARKNIFHDALKGSSTLAEIQLAAVLGAGRRSNFEVDGFSKSHPNPAAARVGNLVFSSGISGQHPRNADVAQQARVAFGHLRNALEQAGGSMDDVGLVTIVVADYAHEPAVLRLWRELFPDPSDEPARHVMAFGGRDSGSYQVQIHLVAALGHE